MSRPNWDGLAAKSRSQSQADQSRVVRATEPTERLGATPTWLDSTASDSGAAPWQHYVRVRAFGTNIPIMARIGRFFATHPSHDLNARLEIAESQSRDCSSVVCDGWLIEGAYELLLVPQLLFTGTRFAGLPTSATLRPVQIYRHVAWVNSKHTTV